MTSNIHDIARLAGVSPATVSLALNGRKGVSEKTKLRVLEIAQQLDYVPNVMAQGLQRGRTNNILVLMSGPQYDYFNSPFYFETLKHFAKGISNTPFQMVLHITTAEEELKHLKMLVSRKGFDGMVMMGLRMPQEEAMAIIGSIPSVFVNRPNVKEAYSVNANYANAMYLVTKHLLELGHRDIAFFGYVPKLPPSENRLIGFRKAYEEYGLEVKAEQLIYADYYQESGYLAMRKWLQSGLALPQAIIGGNDLIALGILEALYDGGVSVPEDVSLAGIDNLSNTHLLKVPLTTVHIRNDLIGMETSAKIIRLLQDEEVERETWIDVQLIKRASTAQRSADIVAGSS
ncbi:LacI family DNA-binding transcriptional regulator [Paenibacillus oryzisoli]|uniref:LacI family DNA-binding transcriptional regulator n=1 Tax=Paenibacillus oryzisoli TaxID=1850517 RepID=UPI003D28114B